MKTVVTTDIHLTNESTIAARPYSAGPHTYWEALSIDEMATIYINSREQAERLFDEVSDLTMRWRERDPEGFRLDAAISHYGSDEPDAQALMDAEDALRA